MSWDVSYTFEERNSYIASITDGNQYVLGLSKLHFEITFNIPIGSGGIDNITVQYGPHTRNITGISKDGYIPSYTFVEEGINPLDYDYIYVSATSIGIHTEKNYSNKKLLSVIPYKAPDFSVSVERVGNTDTNKCAIKLSGLAFSDNIGTVRNSLTVSYAYREVNGATYTDGAITYSPVIGERISPSTGVYVGTWEVDATLPESFDPAKQYEITFVARDQFESGIRVAILYDYMPLWAEFPEKFCVYGELHVHDRNDPSKFTTVRAGMFPVGMVITISPSVSAIDLHDWYGGTWTYLTSQMITVSTTPPRQEQFYLYERTA